ncbi:MAG TPA: hypothetical protein VE713_18460 [Pyrinomonadaceae bacterium]|jgi:hypothetical protein|nr:hypothetical protein [Pyrinomonadaceae bacterium]
MKKAQVRRLVVALVGVCFLATAAAAQEKPGVQPSANLLLQVSRFKDERPQFDSVPCRFWTPIFHRVAASRAAKDALPIQAVQIVARLEEDKVRVNVSLLTGERFPDHEEAVASYLVGVEQQVLVRELAEFGVEPYLIGVVKKDAPETAPPSVVNRTQSIEVSGVEFDFTKAMALRYTLRNLAGKDILAVSLYTTREGRQWATGLRFDREGRALIKAGGAYADSMPVESSATPGADGYVPAVPDTFVVAAVAFADGTYEGNAGAGVAVAIRSIRAGDKIQLTRVVALLRETLAAPDLNTPAALARLQERVAALHSDADEAALAEVSTQCSEFADGGQRCEKTAAEVALSKRKKDVLDELGEFEKESAATPGGSDFGAWLKGRLEKYQAWLARL